MSRPPKTAHTPCDCVDRKCRVHPGRDACANPGVCLAYQRGFRVVGNSVPNKFWIRLCKECFAELPIGHI